MAAFISSNAEIWLLVFQIFNVLAVCWHLQSPKSQQVPSLEHQLLCNTKSDIRSHPKTSSTVPAWMFGHIQNPSCVEWKCLCLGNDFFLCWQVTTWRSTAQRAALWLHRALLALSNSNLTGVAGFQLAAVHTEQLAGAAGKDRAVRERGTGGSSSGDGEREEMERKSC